MSAAKRIAERDSIPAAELCEMAAGALSEFVDVLNRETMLLSAGHLREAGELAAQKTLAAQDYVVLARAVQRAAPRLKREAPGQLAQLQAHHETLATQMAANLRVLATARAVTEDLLNDVARSVGIAESPKTYSSGGRVEDPAARTTNGLAVNRAL